jgi:hypothetical protein
MSKRSSYLAVALVACASNLVAVRAAHAYRPFNGTDADVAAQGELELELGPVQLQHVGHQDYLVTPATVINVGIFRRAELVVDFVGGMPLHAAERRSRYQITNTDVLLKLILVEGALQDQAGPSIAIETGPLIPEINGERGFGASAALIASERWNWLFLHLNNQATLSRMDLTFTWMSSLITELRWNEHIWPVAELLWERTIASGASVYSGLVGVIWSVHDGFALDAAVVVASDDKQAAVEGRLGFTWAIDAWSGSSDAPAYGVHAAL